MDPVQVVPLKTNVSWLLQYKERALQPLLQYLRTLSPTEYVHQLIVLYQEMLQTIAVLHSQQLVCKHIDFSTIAVDSHDRPVLTGFSPDSFQEMSALALPLEVHLYVYLHTRNLAALSHHNVREAIAQFVQLHPLFSTAVRYTSPKEVLDAYQQEAEQFFYSFVNSSFVAERFEDSWNNYALSAVWLPLLVELVNTSETLQILYNNKFIDGFMKLLQMNMHLVPTRRLSVSDTQRVFQELLDATNVTEFEGMIEATKCLMSHTT